MGLTDFGFFNRIPQGRLKAVALGATALIVVAAEPAAARDAEMALGKTGGPQTVEGLRGLSIEVLSNLKVMTVSRRPEPVSQAPAAGLCHHRRGHPPGRRDQSARGAAPGAQSRSSADQRL